MPVGTVIIDFGATPVGEASAVITGLTDMTATAHIEVFLQEDDTTVGLGGIENNARAHEALSYFATKPTATARIAAVGFTAKIRLWAGNATGKFKAHYVYVV